MTIRRWLQTTVGIAALALAAGCGGGGGGGTAAATPTEQDLTVTLTAMTPHVNQLTEFRVVGRDAPRALAARVILDPLPSAAFAITLPKALPSGNFDLDFFADLNGTRTYSAPPADHAWRVAVPSTGQVSFSHNATFTDIGAAAGSEGGNFTLNLTAMTPHVGQLMELRVIKTSNGQTVGAYRLGAIPSAAFSVAIPGIIQNGQSYQVDFFADLNGNGTYDAPPADHAWRVPGTGGATGLSLDFAHNTTFTDIQLVSSGAPRAAARGTVSGFGSVFVNGVEFETNAATKFKVDDNPSATEDNLTVGMVVNVKGVIDDNGATGTATEIEFENSIEGPITAQNLAGGTITVMGKTVKLNDVTVFEGLAPNMADLATGVMVEVSGIEQADGTIVARRIEKKAAGDNEVEIKGTVEGLSGGSFTLGGLTVSYTAGVLDAAITAAGGLANGMLVEVKSGSAPVGGAITATRIDLEDDGVPEDEGAEVRLEGLVTAITSATQFEVADHAVSTNAQTQFRRGVAADLALGRSVEVEGAIDAGGVLVAREVSFELARNVKIEANVGSVAGSTVTVLGIPVTVDALTRLRDKVGAAEALTLDGLVQNDRVKVRAFVDPTTGDAIATKLEKDDPRDRVIVQGPASGVSGNVITILDAPFDTTAIPDDRFRNASGDRVTRTEFLALSNRTVAGQENNLVKLRGAQATPADPVTWERAEIETAHEFENEVENEFEQELEFELESSGGTLLSASLTGAQAVPPITTSAAGVGMVVVSGTQDSISFTLTVSPLPATTVTLAHIHFGATGQEGGVIFNLLPSGTAFTGALSGTLTAANFTPETTVTTFAQAVAAILAGDTYFQVHTLANTGGELRGQILP